MRYSANLNIIIKAIEKVASCILRDFVELENLQASTSSASKFSGACYNKVKKILIEDLTKMRPDYNIFFTDGEKIINKEDAEYRYVIHPIDGLANLTRANPNFTSAISLEHIDQSGNSQPISVAINKLVSGELYYCEKGFGAYLNNRRIRVSKRSTSDVFLIGGEDQSLLNKENLSEFGIKTFSYRSHGSRTLEIGYFSSAKLDGVVFKNWRSENLKPFLLLAKEAGAKILEKEKSIWLLN